MTELPYEKQRAILHDYLHRPDLSIEQIARKHRCGRVMPHRIYKRFFTKKDPFTGQEYLDTSKMRMGGKMRASLGKPNFGKRKGLLKRG